MDPRRRTTRRSAQGWRSFRWTPVEEFGWPPGLVAAQPPSVLRLALGVAIATVRGNHLGALLSQLLVQLIAVVGFVADQVLRLRLDHVEVEGQLHERDLVMVRCVSRDR